MVGVCLVVGGVVVLWLGDWVDVCGYVIWVWLGIYWFVRLLVLCWLFDDWCLVMR